MDKEMDVGICNTTSFCFGVNLCKNNIDPSIWQSDGNSSNAVTKRLVPNKYYGNHNISLKELCLIEERVKRR